jgi:hypothetical protein
MINLALSVGVDCAAVHLLACGSLLECGSGLPSLSTFNTPGRGALIGVGVGGSEGMHDHLRTAPAGGKVDCDMGGIGDAGRKATACRKQ